jgi:Zn-dependent protease
MIRGFNPADLIYLIPSVILAMTFHEVSHGLAAYWLGDKTAKNDGRLSLNPIRHIDWMGLAAIVLVGFGWAKPVMVNPANFKNPKVDFALTAVAGPISNFILAFILILIMSFVAVSTIDPHFIVLLDGRPVFFIDLVREVPINFMAYRDIIGASAIPLMFLMRCALLSLILGVFNLLPIPPLDGSKIFGAVLPDSLYFRFISMRSLMFVLILVLFLGGFGNIISPFVEIMYRGMTSLAMDIFG